MSMNFQITKDKKNLLKTNPIDDLTKSDCTRIRDILNIGLDGF